MLFLLPHSFSHFLYSPPTTSPTLFLSFSSHSLSLSSLLYHHQTSLLISPVIAWVDRKEPSFSLLSPSSAHDTAQGTYLTSCVCWECISLLWAYWVSYACLMVLLHWVPFVILSLLIGNNQLKVNRKLEQEATSCLI